MVGRMLRALLAAVLLAAGVLTVPSVAQARTDYLDVEITSISTPAINLADPGQVIELHGTLTNVSTTPIRYVNVHFWRAPVPITSQEQLLSLSRELPLGARLFEEAAGNLHTLTRDDAFGPGERAEFHVRATVRELTTASAHQPPLPQDDAVYLLGVHVRGIPEGGSNMVVGRAEIPTAATAKPAASSALVLLSAPPSWLPDGSFLTDALSDDLTHRLETLLTSAERPGVIAAVDPALYQAARWLSSEHTVAGEPREGSGVALRWVERVDALAEAGRLWRLPFGNPDLVRADATGQRATVLAWAREAVPEALVELPLVAVLDGAGRALVAELGEFDTVVVRNATGASSGQPRVLTAAPQGSVSVLPDGVQLARRIADELLAPRPLLYVIDTPAAAATDDPLAPHRHHVPAATTPSEPLRWNETTPPTPLTNLAQALKAEAANAALLADLTPDAPAYHQAAIGAASYSTWFTTESAAINYATAASPPDIDLGLITLRTAASYVMGARVNEFPATLSNGLDVPVTVGVEFDSDAPQRIRVPAVDPVHIPARGSATIIITPEASANGVALVHPRLVTAEGMDLRGSESIEITATDLGRVGWIIILVSGAVVLGGTAWRISTVRRERAEQEPSEEEVD
ncbi:MAG: DUF6049 family protein [Propionibacteriaceae bacterium]|nr:DUF6049 family protein [Propionibacteriaceae bacterium]